MNPTFLTRFEEALAAFEAAAPVARPHHRPRLLTAAARIEALRKSPLELAILRDGAALSVRLSLD